MTRAPPTSHFPSMPVHRRNEVGDEIRGIGCAEAGDRIPSRRRRIACNSGIGLVEAGCYIVEVVCVALRIRADLVQGGVDEAEAASVELGSNCDESRPLRSGERCAADVIPARAAGKRTAEQTAVTVGGQGQVDEAPVPALAWNATSGTPRVVAMAVEPAGSVF